MLISLITGVAMQLFQSTADSGGGEKPFNYVVHTASPYHLNVEDPVKDFLDPAIKGTTGLLHSILTHAPSVRRVVITSSSAAVINPKNHAKVYDETYWPTVTWEDAMDPKSTYRCSKVSPIGQSNFPHRYPFSPFPNNALESREERRLANTHPSH